MFHRLNVLSYDFATLYTNIPHEGLKMNIKNLVKEVFKVMGAKYLIVDSHGKAHWSQVPSFVTRCMSLDKSKLVELIEYLIDNVYITAGNKVYRQNISIPMRTDCEPQLANLYLFYHEYSYMRSLLKTNLCLAKRFTDTVRLHTGCTFHSLLELLVRGRGTITCSSFFGSSIPTSLFIFLMFFRSCIM